MLVVRRHEHLRAPWQWVMRDPVAMVAALILAAFTLVAVLDSLHYREALPAGPASEGNSGGEIHYAPELKSALDGLLQPLLERQEKSYSEPFATHLMTKETLTLADGSMTRDYPRLQFGGAHLDDPAAKAGDIAWRGFFGAGLGLAAWGLLVFLTRRLRQGSQLPWRAMLAAVLVLFVLVGGLAALATHYHVLGTDKVGQDVLYAGLKSIRTGVLIGALTTLVTLPLSIGLGISAGYFGGRVDDAVQYLYTTLNAIPGVLLIAAAVLILHTQLESHPDWFETGAERADLRLLFLCLILGMTSWTGLARLLRGETLKVRELDYVAAARAFGVADRRILLRHILPNVQHIVLISVVMDFSGLVLAEAVLSYVGVGVDPSMYSFGNMINGARLELAREPVVWWQLAAAFAFMFTLVLAANLLADSIRDALDPRTQRRDPRIRRQS
jgi:peptide/nickel transport system permease protein